jgi:glycine hydroxymethyltransferase
MVDMAHIAGLVAVGVHPSPVPYADFVTTTTHKTLRGPRGGIILYKEKYAKQLNSAVFPGSQGGPLEHVIAAKGVALREAASPEFATYQKQVLANARAVAQALTEHSHRIVSGGTDNHLMLVDLTSKGVTGKEVQALVETVGITVNKNGIPFDPLPPNKASGMRLGTPATTSRGMREPEMVEIAELINETIIARDEEEKLAQIQARVTALTDRFPLHAGKMY